jgi:hypothetical protein
MEVYPHAFLTATLDGGEWSASRHDRFTPMEISQYALKGSFFVTVYHGLGAVGAEPLNDTTRCKWNQVRVLRFDGSDCDTA